MAAQSGYLGVLSIQTDGVAGTDGWNAVECARDVTVNAEVTPADVTTRGSGGFTQEHPTLMAVSVDVELLWDPEDTEFMEIRDAFNAKTVLGVQAFDVTGGEGWELDMFVQTFTRAEALDGAIVVNATLRPAYNITTLPSYENASTGGGGGGG